MATDVILPALGMSQDTGKIVQWLKAEGEQVAKGEPLAEIETDKATVEIEAPAAGVLAHVAAAAGDERQRDQAQPCDPPRRDRSPCSELARLPRCFADRSGGSGGLRLADRDVLRRDDGRGLGLLRY